MPRAWYNQPEAVAILNAIVPSDLTIEDSFGKLVWKLPDTLVMTLDNIRMKTVDTQVGYTLKQAPSVEAEDRWFTEEESQASVDDILISRWGDPAVLAKYGADYANNLWQKDSNVIQRLSKEQS